MSEQRTDWGIPVNQEPKYQVDRATGRDRRNRATGVAIPDDEPIMIFRAKEFMPAR